VVSSELARAEGTPLSFFSFTPIGLIILLLGIIYMLAVRGWLATPTEKDAETANTNSIHDLIEEYGLHERTKRFVVRNG
ncbi:MAG TPA: SLC13 family permease, partial [Pasteurellaceae bacterium]|nr:SLC13 family permease [Pasteurellaceae bacterium]